MDDEPDHLTLDAQLCFALYSTLHALGRAYGPLLEPLGLTYPQYLVLLVLWEQDDLAVRTLGGRMHLDSGTLTPLLKRMEVAGLVARTRSTEDQRVVRITLTPIGQAMRAQARHIPHRVSCAMGRDMAEIAVLRDDVIRLRETVRASLN